MNTVIPHIEYLVRRHDCVILPSWGAFIAQYQSARYDDEAAVFYPPVREIAFNSDVHHNDGLLISSVARREKISYERASKRVDSELDEMKTRLIDNGEVTIGSIGKFINQPGLSVIFQPSEQFISLESGCLPAVDVLPVIRQAMMDAGIQEPSKDRAPIFGRIMKTAGKVAAAILLTVTIGAALFIPSGDTAHHNYASLSPIVSTHAGETSAKTPGIEDERTVNIPAVNYAQGESESFNATVLTTPTTAEPIAVTPEIEQQKLAVSSSTVEHHNVETPGNETVRFNSTDKYCLIIASFPSQSLANKYIDEKNGRGRMDILAKDGKYRVYIATGETNEQAAAQKQFGDIAANHPSAWVCRR